MMYFQERTRVELVKILVQESSQSNHLSSELRAPNSRATHPQLEKKTKEKTNCFAVIPENNPKSTKPIT